MEPQPNEPPLIAVVGPTASGKSRLAIGLARQFNGEIICADARTLYRGMDIGTAKPTARERAVVKHHLVDVATPGKSVSAADFQKLAKKVIEDVYGRGKIPFLVGGSGLYADSILLNYEFLPKPRLAERRELERLSIEELQARLGERGIDLPTNAKNPRHLIRALETGGAVARRAPREDTLILGLSIEQEALIGRVSERVNDMLASGLEDEVKGLLVRYGQTEIISSTIGYKELLPRLAGETALEEARQEIIRNTLSYSKRQRTWFRRNKSIHWIHGQREAVDLITTFLNTYI